MLLTIWRHGEAEPGKRDHSRQLTGDGRDDVGFGCQQFHDICAARGLPYPDRILYSPLVRTTQTAEIISAAFLQADMKVEGALRPECAVSGVDMAISNTFGTHPAAEHIVLVSHQPLVSNLVDSYLRNEGNVPFLTPGSLVTMTLEVVAPACGQLLFWACPPTYEASR
jgi:phosphohistidine phosphatase